MKIKYFVLVACITLLVVFGCNKDNTEKKIVFDPLKIEIDTTFNYSNGYILGKYAGIQAMLELTNDTLSAFKAFDLADSIYVRDSLYTILKSN